jgi:hypothetical protein
MLTCKKMTELSDNFLAELLAELSQRMPAKFGLIIADGWGNEGLLEVLEFGLRTMLDSIDLVQWQHSYDVMCSLHQLLLHADCAAFDAVLSQSDKGRKMTELLARSLLITTFALSRSYNISTNKNDDAIKAFVRDTREITVCLSTALLPEHLWVLDETLSLLNYAEMGKNTRHFYDCDSFCQDFFVELQGCYIEYVDQFSSGSFAKVGKSAVHNISRWTDKKRDFIRAAERTGRYDSATLHRFALLNKKQSQTFMRDHQQAQAQAQAQVKTTPTTVACSEECLSTTPFLLPPAPSSSSTSSSVASAAAATAAAAAAASSTHLRPPTKKRSRTAVELDFDC